MRREYLSLGAIALGLLVMALAIAGVPTWALVIGLLALASVLLMLLMSGYGVRGDTDQQADNRAEHGDRASEE